jgi:hypothetical protein
VREKFHLGPDLTSFSQAVRDWLISHHPPCLTGMVFISYRHENTEHGQRVLAFAKELLAAGVKLVLDQLYLKENPGGPDEGWPAWCDRQVVAADKVLVIASPGWFRCFEKEEKLGVGLGAACEAHVIRQEIYDAGTVTAKHRIVGITTSSATIIPTLLRGFHRYDGEKADDVDAILQWLGHPRVPKASIDRSNPWPAVAADGKWPFADATDVRDGFAELMEERAEHRILLIRGGSEVGKTSISKYLLSKGMSLPWLACGRLDLKGSTGLEQELRRFAEHLVADGKTVDEVLGTGGTVDRLQRLIAHLRLNPRPTLLIIDTYDEAQDREYAEWMESLLRNALRCEWLRVIVTGQKVHHHWTSLAHGIARYLELRVPDISDWVECAKVHSPHLTEDFVHTLHAQVGGSAGLIAGIIFKLPTPRA